MIIIRNTKKTCERAIVVQGVFDAIHDLMLGILLQNPDMNVNQIKEGIKGNLVIILDAYNSSGDAQRNKEYLNKAKAFIAHFIREESVEAVLL